MVDKGWKELLIFIVGKQEDQMSTAKFGGYKNNSGSSIFNSVTCYTTELLVAAAVA